MFPALGFGARMPDGSVSHEFALVSLHLFTQGSYLAPKACKSLKCSFHLLKCWDFRYFVVILRRNEKKKQHFPHSTRLCDAPKSFKHWAND